MPSSTNARTSRSRCRQGIVHGDSVTCPLHNYRISLRTGEALGDDKGCTPTIPLKLEAGRIFLLREAVLGRQAA